MPQYRLMDSLENCRGVAVVDVRGDGELGLACGNWQVRLIASTYATVAFMLNFWLYWNYGIFKHKSCHMPRPAELIEILFSVRDLTGYLRLRDQDP